MLNRLPRTSTVWKCSPSKRWFLRITCFICLIDRHIPFDFIRDATAHLYSADNGRPAVDPVQLFKMRFIGCFFGIRSERQLVREIQVNVAYRGFLGLALTDRVIDVLTFLQNRLRRTHHA